MKARSIAQVLGGAFILILIQSVFSVQAQDRVSSGKAWIHINNEPAEEVNLKDNTAPLIKIMSPKILDNEKYVTNKSEINLLGKITDDISGINRIFINTEKFELSGDGLFMQNIRLENGVNTINIVAVDNSDNIASLNLQVECTSGVVKEEDNLKTGKYYALLIGINDYEDPGLTNLDYPIEDAQSLYDVLVEDYMFDEENVTMLKNARRKDINMALDNLARKVTNDDNLLIFYAGHGWWDENADIGYWLPADAHKYYKTEWFRNSTLQDYIREINSKHTLLITDACFGGSILKTRSISMEAPKAIQMLYELRSRKAMTSGTLTEVPDRSSFVKFLIKRLDENEEKCLSSEQLFSSFRIAVINNSDVVPQYGEIKNVGDEGGDFIFIRRD
jgi:hypothetical protein